DGLLQELPHKGSSKKKKAIVTARLLLVAAETACRSARPSSDPSRAQSMQDLLGSRQTGRGRQAATVGCRGQSAAADPLRIGQLVEGMPQAFAPAAADHAEVGMVLGDIDMAMDFQCIAGDANQIERQAHRKIRSN